jgi:hypothetical protein
VHWAAKCDRAKAAAALRDLVKTGHEDTYSISLRKSNSNSLTRKRLPDSDFRHARGAPADELLGRASPAAAAAAMISVEAAESEPGVTDVAERVRSAAYRWAFPNEARPILGTHRQLATKLAEHVSFTIRAISRRGLKRSFKWALARVPSQMRPLIPNAQSRPLSAEMRSLFALTTKVVA